jgi:hypothetical protein
LAAVLSYLRTFVVADEFIAIVHWSEGGQTSMGMRAISAHTSCPGLLMEVL